jgi:hypothetical protein
MCSAAVFTSFRGGILLSRSCVNSCSPCESQGTQKTCEVRGSAPISFHTARIALHVSVATALIRRKSPFTLSPIVCMAHSVTCSEVWCASFMSCVR